MITYPSDIISPRGEVDLEFELICNWLLYKVMCRWRKSFWEYVYSLNPMYRRKWMSSIKMCVGRSACEYLWSKKQMYEAELSLLNFELVCVGREIVTRCSHASWWFWDIESRLIFWRWPKKHQLDALRGQTPWLSDPLQQYRA